MPGTAKTAPLYRERLYLSWWWWLFSAAVGALFAVTAGLGLGSVPRWLPFAVLVPLFLLFVWRIGAGLVQIGARGGGVEVRVRRAHLPLDAVGAVVELDAGAVRLLAGRHGDPAAYVVLQPWIGPGVQIIVDDPDDPAPYWLFSSRHPGRIAAVLRAARAEARLDGSGPAAGR